jgi:hypothetical protein
MSQVRVHNFSVSLDGFGAGEEQSLDAPFGHAQVATAIAFEIRSAGKPPDSANQRAGTQGSRRDMLVSQ